MSEFSIFAILIIYFCTIGLLIYIPFIDKKFNIKDEEVYSGILIILSVIVISLFR